MSYSVSKLMAALSSIFCGITFSSALADPIIKVGTATKGGDKTITLTLPGGGKEVVTVPGISAGETPTDKVIDALNASTCCNGTRDTAGRVEVGGATDAAITSTTGEKDIIIAGIEPLRDPAQAVLAYAGSLQGVDAVGGIAVYGALISLDGRTADVTVPFGSLGTPTLGGAISAVYASLLTQLDPADRTRLTMTGTSLLFNFPAGASDASASMFTTDTGLSATVGIQAVPEPSSVALLGAGLLVFAVVYRQTRYKQIAARRTRT